MPFFFIKNRFFRKFFAQTYTFIKNPFFWTFFFLKFFVIKVPIATRTENLVFFKFCLKNVFTIDGGHIFFVFQNKKFKLSTRIGGRVEKSIFENTTLGLLVVRKKVTFWKQSLVLKGLSQRDFSFYKKWGTEDVRRVSVTLFCLLRTMRQRRSLKRV